MFFPVPSLQEFFREGIAVGVTLRIEARAWIAIPIPGAAHATPRLKDPDREPTFPQPVQLSLSRLNHWLPRHEAHPEVMQGTTEFHHQIADARLPQPDPVFHNAT